MTLKPSATEAGGFDLDLNTPDAHKTAAAFGPSRTAVPAATAKLLTAWLQLAKLNGATAAAQQPYVFVLTAKAGHAAPVDAKCWTKVVQAAFKRQSGVALAPKDLRSSYITWLRSEENGDATLKAAALAMRHSVTQQAAPAYDKGAAARLNAACTAAAETQAQRFR